MFAPCWKIGAEQRKKPECVLSGGRGKQAERCIGCGSKPIPRYGIRLKNFSMKKISNNKFIDAAFKLMMLSSVIHIVTSVIAAVFYQDLNRLNYFDIVDLELFGPNLSGNIFATFISFVVIAVLYSIIFIFF